jgi:hypothetical protein
VIGNLLRHFKPTAILHVSSDTRRSDDVSLDEVERIVI